MLIGCGTLVVLWTLGWVVAYFAERGLDVASLSVAVTAEAGYWAPVLLLGLPGFVLIHHGRRLLLRGGLSVFAMGEVAMVFAILGILVALVFPVDNFSYVAASIVQNGVAAAQPTQSRVAEHHSLHGAFPGPGTVPVASLQARAADRHIRSITHGEGGRVVI
uniref:hypothetical protein n=1 Tax=Sedimenticola sp. TaxID=1940285 RepID=UPI003D097613